MGGKKVDKEKQTWLEREEVDDKDDFTRLNIGNKKTPANVFEKISLLTEGWSISCGQRATLVNKRASQGAA